MFASIARSSACANAPMLGREGAPRLGIIFYSSAGGSLESVFGICDLDWIQSSLFGRGRIALARVPCPQLRQRVVTQRRRLPPAWVFGRGEARPQALPAARIANRSGPVHQRQLPTDDVLKALRTRGGGPETVMDAYEIGDALTDSPVDGPNQVSGVSAVHEIRRRRVARLASYDLRRPAISNTISDAHAANLHLHR